MRFTEGNFELASASVNNRGANASADCWVAVLTYSKGGLMYDKYRGQNLAMKNANLKNILNLII